MDGRAWWNKRGKYITNLGDREQSHGPHPTIPAPPVPTDINKAELLRLATEVEDGWVRDNKKR